MGTRNLDREEVEQRCVFVARPLEALPPCPDARHILLQHTATCRAAVVTAVFARGRARARVCEHGGCQSVIFHAAKRREELGTETRPSVMSPSSNIISPLITNGSPAVLDLAVLRVLSTAVLYSCTGTSYKLVHVYYLSSSTETEYYVPVLVDL